MNNRLEKPILVFIAADDCGACQYFKNVWTGIKEKLTDVEIIEINLQQRNHAGDPRNFPIPAIAKYVGWFPTFLLIERKNYNINNFKAKIFNGEMNPGPTMKDKYQRTAEGFERWIAEERELPMEREMDRHDSHDRHEQLQPKQNDPVIEKIKKRKLVSSIRGPAFELTGDR